MRNAQPCQGERPRVAYVLAAAIAVRPMLGGQLRSLRRRGYDVRVVCSPGPQLDGLLVDEGARVHPLLIAREISPWADLVALWRLYFLFRRLRPEIVNAGTPKAGLLGLAAAWLAGVPCRVYTLHGLRLETARGFKRWLLLWTERLSCAAADCVICVGDDLRRRAVAMKLVRKKKTVVLGRGSTNGIDANRFGDGVSWPHGAATRDAASGNVVSNFARTPASAWRAAPRQRWGIPADAPVIGFVGRLTRDKGVVELLKAFERLRSRFPGLRLLLLGWMEEGDPLPPEARSRIQNDPRIVWPGAVEDTAPYYAAIDVLALPSYREGLPITVLEASAAGRPVVASRATGLADCVLDGVTGLLVPVGDVGALAEAIGGLLADPARARQMGRAGQRWVRVEFSQERLWKRLAGLYEALRATGSPQTGAPAAAKRVLDLAGALMGLVFAAPVMALTAAVLAVFQGQPVLFRQVRPGLRNRPFTIVKFRTMNERRDESGALLADEQRLTRLGALLRRFSLDELPQLWNVLRGEMSLVGPRPLLSDYLERYTPEQRRRHNVKPGLTGWAQVQGRNALPWDERFALDVWYADHWSVALDGKILLRTASQVLRGRGVRAGERATAEVFRGTLAQEDPL